MMIFSRLDASFPVQGAKNVKFKKKCQMIQYIDIALSGLVFQWIKGVFSIGFLPNLDKIQVYVRTYLKINLTSHYAPISLCPSSLCPHLIMPKYDRVRKKSLAFLSMSWKISEMSVMRETRKYLLTNFSNIFF